MPEALNNPQEKRPRLAELEELVLLAITGLKDKAYGVAIRARLQEVGRNVAPGALYTLLARLQDKKLIESSVGQPTAERGGRAKVFYSLTEGGQEALEAVEGARTRLRGYLVDHSAATTAQHGSRVLLTQAAAESKRRPQEIPVRPATPVKSTPAPVAPRPTPPQKAEPEPKPPRKDFPSIYDTF